MTTEAVDLLYDLIRHRSPEVLAGLALLCAIGIVIGTRTARYAPGRRVGRVLSREASALLLWLSLFCFGDWVLLRALPILRISFATQILPPLVVSVLVRLVILWAVTSALFLARWRTRRLGGGTNVRSLGIFFLVINLAFSAVQIDAYVVEPLLVDVTERALVFDDLDPDAPPVRIVHLVDIHIERSSYREAIVVREVNALQPDIIVLTGDYLNLSRLRDPVSVQHFRDFVSQLRAPYGIYAVRGTVEPTPAAMSRLIDGTGVVWLEQRAIGVDVRGQEIVLAGVACSHRQNLDATRLDQALSGIPQHAFTLLLYHSPDLIAEAAGRSVDLYLGGHTHGGQLRLPFYGPIVTGSIYGKRYVAGLYERGDTTLYVSRGIGLEGGGMPRARFLCRPEIVSLDLHGAS